MAKTQTQTITQEALRTSFRGELIDRTHPSYDSARRIYNGMIDRHPTLIARCLDVADVIAAVNYGRENDLLVSVRGGGHNGPGFAVCDDGLVIDLSMMKGIHVDPVKRLVRVEGGCTQGEINHATGVFEQAVPAGIVSTTGIAGLTLGGGHGYLTRCCGLAIDNLVEADLVLADGRLVKANERENADLFWAIRGGGGNFGIVVSFLFRTHPVGTVLAGPMFWPIDQTMEILRWYREYQPAAPGTDYGFPSIMRVPPVPLFPQELHLRPVCGMIWCFSGPMADAERALGRIRKALPAPLLDAVGPMPLSTLLSLFDPLLPPGLQWYWKGDFVSEIPDEAIEIHRRFGETIPGALSTMHLYPIDGEAGRVPQDATAFSHRDAKWSMVIAGIDPDPANAEAISTWARNYWEALRPYTRGGAYINFMMEEGVDRIKATYRGNYERLVAIKAKYDPENFFCMNQNIVPAGARAHAHSS